MKPVYFLPAIGFVIVVIYLVKGLELAQERAPSFIPSVLINTPVTKFKLDAISGQHRGLSYSDLIGKVSIVNVFASWCVPCRAEHDILMLLSRLEGVEIYGLNYKDNPIEAKNFIEELGNPYINVGIDEKGRTGIDWGVYGIPESFIIHNGRVVYKHIGPIHISELDDTILPILKGLK